VIARLAALAVVLAASPVLAESYTYVNARFGTAITFPDEIFSQAERPPDNGDGMTWTSRDGASLSVYGSYNVLELTPAELADQASESDAADFRVTYRQVKSDWVVVSGIEGDMIFYQRLELGADDVIHGMLLKYPAARRAAYDRLAGTIAASLKGP